MTLVTTAAALMLGFALDTRPPSAIGGQFGPTDVDRLAAPHGPTYGPAAELAPSVAPPETPRRLATAEVPEAEAMRKHPLGGDASTSKVRARPMPAALPALSAPMTYPATQANMIAVAPTAPDPAEAAAAEAALDLSARARREVQRRLSLADHDPMLVDGVFGPATRTAIAAWQEEAGLPANGYLDARTLEVLVARTEDDYRAWRIAARKRGNDRARMAALESPIPVASPAMQRDGCRRLRSGEIVYGQNFRCDFRGLREDLGMLPHEMAELLRNS